MLVIAGYRVGPMESSKIVDLKNFKRKTAAAALQAFADFLKDVPKAPSRIPVTGRKTEDLELELEGRCMQMIFSEFEPESPSFERVLNFRWGLVTKGYTKGPEPHERWKELGLFF